MSSSPSVAEVLRSNEVSSGIVSLDLDYLLLTFVPYYVDERGDVWLEQLWHHDFLAHFRYLPRIALAAPRRAKQDGPADLLKVEVPEGATLTLVPLPYASSTREALRALPELTRRLWAAIGEADVVHSGVAGWPIPPGWIANPIALARRRPLVLIVESAPWRTSGIGHTRARERLRELVTEALARFYVRRADVTLFTQPEYRRTLARPATRGCHITPAAWIDEGDIATEQQARASWTKKAGEPPRCLLAARLVRTKGVDVLLEALAELDRRGVRARVDVIGEGPRRGACEEAARSLRSVDLHVLDPVPYGRAFFELVRAHHAVLVPNLGDEQPRIVFDAYAQAVPVIAFDTDGLRPYVHDGRTGWLVPRGVASLADAIARASEQPAELSRMGTRALSEAPRYTHRAMHEERSRIFAQAFAGLHRGGAFGTPVRS